MTRRRRLQIYRAKQERLRHALYDRCARIVQRAYRRSHLALQGFVLI